VFADEQRQLPDLSYHVLDIAAEIEDRSGAAAKDRERFLTLVLGAGSDAGGARAHP
jgi:hypothetical protein